MNIFKKAVILFIAEGAYAGRFPFVPGTAGTLIGVLLYLGMKGLTSLAYFMACVLIIFIGTWVAGRAEDLLGSKDHPSIVIDEVAGYLVAMFMVTPGWGFIVGGFFLFRVFDIVKPYPLRWFQSFHGGPGVMLDDIGAGIYTNLVLQIGAALLKGIEHRA